MTPADFDRDDYKNGDRVERAIDWADQQ